MKKNIKLKGFTLVETIMVCVLTFMIMACAFTILSPMRNIYKETYNTKDTMDVNNFVGEAIEKDLRYATRLYIFKGFHAENEEEFMQNCVTAFRKDFLFKSNSDYPQVKKRIFGNEATDDVVYVMKLDCRDNATDGKSRGYVSRYQYDQGVLNTVDSKINFVNPVLFDDRNNNRGYTIDYTLGFVGDNLEKGIKKDADDPVVEAVNPEDLSIILSTYKSRLDSVSLANNRSSVVPDFEDTLAQQVISFPLVNIAENGKISYELISYEKENGKAVTPKTIASGEASGSSLISVPRYKYYDVHSTSLPALIDPSEGNEIYFVYTLLNIPE